MKRVCVCVCVLCDIRIFFAQFERIDYVHPGITAIAVFTIRSVYACMCGIMLSNNTNFLCTQFVSSPQRWKIKQFLALCGRRAAHLNRRQPHIHESGNFPGECARERKNRIPPTPLQSIFFRVINMSSTTLNLLEHKHYGKMLAIKCFQYKRRLLGV